MIDKKILTEAKEIEEREFVIIKTKRSYHTFNGKKKISYESEMNKITNIK